MKLKKLLNRKSELVPRIYHTYVAINKNLRKNLPSALEKSPIVMKAKVYVTLKPGVLDPQGKAIQHSVELMGFEKITDIRQGKYFEVALDDSLTVDEARRTAEQIANDVLANPVIEDYHVEID